MHPNERRSRAVDAAQQRFPFLLSASEARTLLDWSLSEEAVAGWMDWADEGLRCRLARFMEAVRNGHAPRAVNDPQPG